VKNNFNIKDLSCIWVTSDVLSNLFKFNNNLPFKALNSIKNFLAKYNSLSSLGKERKQGGRKSIIFEKLPDIMRDSSILNLIDDCLLNCFKLLKNVLRPETISDNFEEFDSNWGLKHEILILFDRTINAAINKTQDYTLNDIKLNLNLMAFLKNIYERNGYTINSFKIPGEKLIEQEQTNWERYFDIEHIITNLDLSILANFL
jgi:hypothetical protein